MRSPLALALLVVVGCAAEAPGDRGRAGPLAVERPADGTWEPLVTLDWTVDPGVEQFTCGVATVPKEVLARRLRAIAPMGTHHVLATLAAGGPEGTFTCAPGTLSDVLLFASGTDAGTLALPPGVAMRIPAGAQVLVNVHLLNPRADALSGTSGIEVQAVPPGDVTDEAEMILAGTTEFQIAPHSVATATGRCRFRADATVTHLWPHMHLLGTHMRVTHHGQAGDVTLLDAPYEFDDQRHYAIEPAQVREGESLSVTCTWDNTTDRVVSFGDSTLDEMCFAGVVRYPATYEGLHCQPEGGGG